MTGAYRKRMERKRRAEGIPPNPSKRTSSKMVAVRNCDTGDVYDSYAAAAFANGFSPSSLEYAVKHSGMYAGCYWEAV